MASLRRLGLTLLSLVLAVGTATRVDASPDVSLLDLVEIELGYTTLAEQYYRAVNPQILLDGARSGIIAYLRSRGIADPNVAIMRARADGRGAVPAIDRDVALAIERYGSRVTPRGLAYAVIRGEAASLHDPYTVFFTKPELAKFTSYVEGERFGGIGVVLAIDAADAPWRVDQVFDGGPAAKAGIVTGDIITAVDGTSTSGLALARANTLLRGAAGTPVSLTIVRSGTALPAPVTIVRAHVTPPEVVSRLLSGNAGYVQLRSFGLTAEREIRSAVEKLRAQGAQSLILDLRDNGGGYEASAIRVASEFVPSGPIVTVQERRGKRRTANATGNPLPHLPLVVLVNHNTASASELVAAAIQDARDGTIVGTTTYGKGLVQTIVPLPDGAAVKVTTARYFTRAGRDIDRVGIAPDIGIDEPADARLGVPGADAQLDRALALLAPGSAPAS